MFTISCYTFHPLIQRFVRLWRQVQVVSDWLAWVLSLLCCQCSQPVPMSYSVPPSTATASFSEIESIKIDSDRAGGEPLRPQHLVIGFTPEYADDAVGERCSQFWELIRNQPELDGTMVVPDLEKINVPVHKKSSQSPTTSKTPQPAFTALEAIRRMDNNGAICAALHIAN